ncbi:TonB-dependent receptor (plasmid) [Hymenobacter sp. NBH84]|uniref:SusC/RagA family TonB-linked outer membrane protein n=1 Tax=Hymenobacter sp. NBH84 TaxID=2596915 RepID=UPI0016269ECD|nr:TonB-dependent receptor [Hymenobacter sp. NBH84]QNE42328.1 TonB-dependent receptor [Hymenobacter sp. NBH84]
MRASLQTIAVVLCSTTAAFAQQRVVQGVVTDTQGEPLPGTTILVKGTTTGVTAGADGSFQLGLPTGATTLVVSSVGSKTQEIPIGTQTNFRITLSADAQTLNDVVVVGYGTARKSDLTGSVASVTGAQLTQVATSDPVQALQGRVAGVDITSNSGQPGSGTRIRVRGVGTINNSDPLYVVDGVQTSDISFLLPTDIESTEILKDASATAIYGSRGANGVVIITTKHGKAGQTQFNAFAYTGFQQIRRTLPLASGQEYATLVTEAYANANAPIPADYRAILNSGLQGNSSFDYQDFVTQKGLIANYSLSASGGTEQNRYLISGNYFQQDGIVKQSGLKKYVVRFNDDATLTKFLKAGVSATFTHANQTGAGDGTGNPFYSTVLQNAIQANPITSPYNADGSYSYNTITSFTPNLGRYLDEQKFNKTRNNTLFSSAYLDVSLLKGLNFRSTFGITYNNTQAKAYQPQYFLGPNDQRNQSALSETRLASVSWVWSNYFNYTKTFADNSSFTATLGQESQRNTFEGIGIRGFDVPASASLQYLTAARSANFTLITPNPSDASLLSYFGRANYNFRDRYLLTGTLRFDQTSRFLGSQRTGVFPSLGAAWNISNEAFLKDATAISQLKLRASYGAVGNQNAAPNYGYASTAVNNQNYVFGVDQTRAPGLAVATLNNPDLKWETAVTFDVGVDAAFLDNRLTFTGDIFERKTKDMIALLPVPDYVGQAPATANVGTLRNRGLELALNYRNEIGKLQYNAGVNFTKINNVITDLGGANPIASGNVISQIGNTTRTDVGREVAYFYGLKADGIFRTQEEVDSYRNAAGAPIQPGAQPGDVRYRDINGDGEIDATDNTYLGSATPSFTYGASLNLSYSNFDFKILLYGVQGAEAVNAGAFNLSKSSIFSGIWTNFYADRMDRWTPSNPNSDQPRVTSNDTNNGGGYNDRFSSRHVENASFLRARNMELGYSLPRTVLDQFKISGFRVFASVDNVFTITKYRGLDPEISATGYYNNPLAYGVDYGNYPQPRTYRLGLNVQF